MKKILIGLGILGVAAIAGIAIIGKVRQSNEKNVDLTPPEEDKASPEPEQPVDLKPLTEPQSP